MQPLIVFDSCVDEDNTFILPFKILNDYTIIVSDEYGIEISDNKIYIQGKKVFLNNFYDSRTYPHKVTVKFITKDFWC